MEKLKEISMPPTLVAACAVSRSDGSETRPRQRSNQVRQGLGPRPHYFLTLMKLVASGNGAAASSEQLLPGCEGDLPE